MTFSPSARADAIAPRADQDRRHGGAQGWSHRYALFPYLAYRL